MDVAEKITELDATALLALKHLLEGRSVSVAARAMATSQPSMSRTLRRLRRLFGDRLLVQVGQRLTLTSYARELAPRVDAALAAMRRLFDEPASFAPALAERTLRIAASDYSTVVVLQPWLRTLRAQAPGLRVRIEPIGGASVGPLARGDLDLVIGPKVRLEGTVQFVFRKMLSDPMVCVLRRAHPRAKGRLTLSAYLALEHVTVAIARANVSDVGRALKARGKERRVAVVAPSFLAALALVRDSDFAAILPEALVRSVGTGVISHVLPFDLEPMTSYLAWHPRSTTDPLHRWVREGIWRAAQADSATMATSARAR